VRRVDGHRDISLIVMIAKALPNLALVAAGSVEDIEAGKGSRAPRSTNELRVQYTPVSANEKSRGVLRPPIKAAAPDFNIQLKFDGLHVVMSCCSRALTC